MHRVLVASCLAIGSALVAQSVVVPNANANVRGTSQLNSIVRNAGNPRTYQYGVNAAELAGVPIGSVITGVSLRFMVFTTNAASWPPADITWTSYDIWAGPALPTASWGGDAFANFASPPLQVRSGPLVLDAGSFTNLNPTAPTPNPWSEFYFDFQVPYLYLGGDLALLFSHPGSLDPANASFPETVVSSVATYGGARTQSVYPPGTASLATTFYVMRIHYGYGTGCPGSSGTAPVLVQNGDTTGGAGGTIRLQVGNAPPATAVIYALGFSQTLAPLGNGCSLLLSPAATLIGFTNQNGRATLNVAVPPALTASFFAQAGVLDLTAPGGFSVTNAVSPTAN